MKIASWNCGGSFRSKYKKILTCIDADIYVIQECESIDKFDDDFTSIVNQYFWCKGRNKKGLLIFSKTDVKLTKLEWNDFGMRSYLPLLINDEILLL